MKDKWNHSEPPKDRWIIRVISYGIKPKVKCIYNSNKWVLDKFFRPKYYESDFIPNLWMEAPQKPEI